MEERKENEGPSDNEGNKKDEPVRKEPQQYNYSQRRPPKRKKSSKPTISGALLLVVAVLGMLFSLIMVGSGFILDDVEDWSFVDGGTTTIEGQVVDENGDPIENATITIVDTHLETETDVDGNYKLVGVPNGFQEIRVEKSGYKTIIHKTMVNDNDSTKENYNIHDGEVHRKGDTYDYTLPDGSGELTYGVGQDTLEKIFGDIHGFLTITGIITLICSIVALIGGIFALKREHFGITVAAAVVGIFSFGFAIGSILSIIALFILVLASDEFGDEDENNY